MNDINETGDINDQDETQPETKAAHEENPMQKMLQEEYLKNSDNIEEGQLIEGTVIELTNEFVFLDVGLKSEGKVPVIEFQKLPAMGEKVSVLLLYKEGRNGQVVVSKRRADDVLVWKKIAKSYREKLPVEAVIAKTVKGGFEATIDGSVTAFVPISKVDTQRVTNEQEYIGLKANFYIDRYHGGNKKSLVLSRRAFLEDASIQKKEEFFSTRKVGDVITGTVKSITSFGAFVDLGGFDGLLHINDMSWGRVTRPKDFVKKGDEVTVKIVGIDHEAKKINLSLKELAENPWHTFEERYHVGDIVEGTVLRLTDFGAFVELESGIEGLVHVSELSWVKKVRHPKDVLTVNDIVKVKILGYDAQKEKVSLSLKHVMVNPWDTLDERFPMGSKMTRKVKNLSATGAFFELEEGIDGFLHVDDLSYTKKVKSIEEALKVDDEVEFMIIGIDKKERRIRLGMKQLQEDPWKTLAELFKEGSMIEGTVSEVKDAGVVVKVQGEIEGFIRKMNLCDPEVESPDAVIKKFKPGDTVRALVEEISAKRKRLSLSLREYNKRLSAEEMGKYLHKDSDQGETTTFGDLLKKKENK
ncbi:MAG: 30S ribosomal protein S1 [Spirochaetaceae bacterium]|nr:MAG: 30S ribosomal protein S1 [Spirochaetaceae bacterium]